MDQHIIFAPDVTAAPIVVAASTTTGALAKILSVGDVAGDGIDDVAWSKDGVTTVDFGPIGPAGPRATTVLK